MTETYPLSKRGEPGLAVDREGVALGPVALVEKIGDGETARYRRRPLAEIEKALKLAYGKASAGELAATLTGLEAAAGALNRRRLFDATLAAGRMRLQPLSPQAVLSSSLPPTCARCRSPKPITPISPASPPAIPMAANGGWRWNHPGLFESRK